MLILHRIKNKLSSHELKKLVSLVSLLLLNILFQVYYRELYRIIFNYKIASFIESAPIEN